MLQGSLNKSDPIPVVVVQMVIMEVLPVITALSAKQGVKHVIQVLSAHLVNQLQGLITILIAINVCQSVL